MGVLQETPFGNARLALLTALKSAEAARRLQWHAGLLKAVAEANSREEDHVCMLADALLARMREVLAASKAVAAQPAAPPNPPAKAPPRPPPRPPPGPPPAPGKHLFLEEPRLCRLLSEMCEIKMFRFSLAETQEILVSLCCCSPKGMINLRSPDSASKT